MTNGIRSLCLRLAIQFLYYVIYLIIEARLDKSPQRTSCNFEDFSNQIHNALESVNIELSFDDKFKLAVFVSRMNGKMFDNSFKRAMSTNSL